MSVPVELPNRVFARPVQPPRHIVQELLPVLHRRVRRPVHVPTVAVRRPGKVRHRRTLRRRHGTREYQRDVLHDPRHHCLLRQPRQLLGEARLHLDQQAAHPCQVLQIHHLQELASPEPPLAVLRVLVEVCESFAPKDVCVVPAQAHLHRAAHPQVRNHIQQIRRQRRLERHPLLLQTPDGQRHHSLVRVHHLATGRKRQLHAHSSVRLGIRGTRPQHRPVRGQHPHLLQQRQHLVHEPPDPPRHTVPLRPRWCLHRSVHISLFLLLLNLPLWRRRVRRGRRSGGGGGDGVARAHPRRPPHGLSGEVLRKLDGVVRPVRVVRVADGGHGRLQPQGDVAQHAGQHPVEARREEEVRAGRGGGLGAVLTVSLPEEEGVVVAARRHAVKVRLQVLHDVLEAVQVEQLALPRRQSLVEAHVRQRRRHRLVPPSRELVAPVEEVLVDRPPEEGQRCLPRAVVERRPAPVVEAAPRVVVRGQRRVVRLGEQADRVAGGAVDEGGAQLRHDAGQLAAGVDAAADAGARLEHEDVVPRRAQRLRGADAGDAGADDGHALVRRAAAGKARPRRAEKDAKECEEEAGGRPPPRGHFFVFLFLFLFLFLF
eukprot:Rhum_TRINITY_DN14232_c3_g1::Rhum_TRINITY_DN14232_c3_g1_i1::g.74487::m.74487